MNNLLENLNEEQIKPVTDTEGAVLVLAGAGSVKTRVLTTRIAYILDQGLAKPWQILAITFTNKAAGEMRERVQTQIGECRDMWICTIHSMCVKILRANTDAAGIKPDFSIYSETERKNVIKKCIKELDFDADKLLKPAKFHIANAKMLGLDPDQYAKRNEHENHIDECVKVYERYEEKLRENNALDFDDLLLYTLRLFRKNAEIRQFYADRFKYIMVDEFQDTNAVQYGIIKLMVKEGGNLFCVGDDDQSIYGWRGAEIENILRFDRDYPKAKVYKLERNYRSTGNILSLANTIIKNNGNRRGKTLWTEAGEGDKPVYFTADNELGEALYTAKTISDLVNKGYKYSDFAVLLRINAITRPFEQEFSKYNIPYKVFGGLKFFERKEVKDILAYMRLIANPFDSEALARIINVPKRGIGGRTIEIMEEYAYNNGLSLYDAVLDCEYLDVSSGTKKKLADFGNLIKDFVIQSQAEPVNNLVRSLIAVTGLRDALEDENDIANVDEFVASVDDYIRLNPDSTLSDYLSAITLYSDTDEMDDSNYVTLATIHAVKGLEFRAVFIAGLEDGIMPSSRVDDGGKELEEERRLMYVAITRAREKLYLTRALERNLYGRRDRTIPSRFIKELSQALGLKDNIAYGGNRYQKNSNYGSYNGRYASTNGGGRAVYSSSDDDYAAIWTAHSNPYASPAKSFSSDEKKPPAKQQGGKYRVGTKVRHAKFGNGTVVALRNNGAVINVAFDDQGIKELSAAIAPLTIIQY
ncbi:MAG: UvrD-helicase domain-containing protein [Clostridia bacterium]|nr:UvrD-helicase domain-containing protein [Clostridia bacterium]